MLRIYPIALLVARDAALAAKQVTRADPDLARQLRRASASIPLNIAEGAGSRGRNRVARYADALGSARETSACFDLAYILDYVPRTNETDVRQRLDHVIGVLVKLTR